MLVFRFRYPLIIFFFIAGILAAVVAARIGPLTEQEAFLENSHELMVLLDDVRERFPSANNLKEDSIVVNLHWGVKDLDREEVGLWDSTNLGTLEWDDTFTVSPIRN